MSLKQNKTRHPLAVPLLLLALLSACEEEQVVTTTRNIDRPGPMAMVCVGRVGDGGVTTGLSPSACTSDGGAGTLYGFVANTSRGEVAVFRPGASGEPLVDLDEGSPGFGFIPVGSLPTDLTATRDGCRVVTTNQGSCDLAVIDVPAVMGVASGELKRPYGGVVSRVIPRTASGRALRARPQSLVLVPSSDPRKNDQGSCPLPTHPPDGGTSWPPPAGNYHAYVTFPRCNLVAEIDLATGLMVRGVVVTRQGYYPTVEPSCPVECTLRSDKGRVDSGVQDLGRPPDLTASSEPQGPVDAGAGEPPLDGQPPGEAGADGPRDMAPPPDAGSPDLPAPVDAAPSDSRPSDSAAPTSGDVLPYGLAVKTDGSRLYVSSANAGFISVMDVDAKSGALVNPRRITLAGEVGTTQIRLSPGSIPEWDEDQKKVVTYQPKVGQFLYAVARDRSVRVVLAACPAGQAACEAAEKECETNLDLATIDGGAGTVSLAKGRCYVVGGKETPPRRVTQIGTGLRFGLRVPQSVTFVTSHAAPPEAGVAEAGPAATPLRGIFALVALSDGSIYVVDVEDWNTVRIKTDAGIPVLHLPHRVRNALQGLVEGKPDASVTSISGVGTGGVPVVVSGFERSCSENCPVGAKCGDAGTCVNPGGGIFLRAPGESIPSEWNMIYEGRLVGRWSGNLAIAAAADRLLLADRGANFCQAGVLGRKLDQNQRQLRHGDIVVFNGCSEDDECGLDQVCVKPVTQQTERGLCFDKDRQDELFQRCADFLRGDRELRVVRAEQDQLFLDALPVEPQTIVLQSPQPTGGCCPDDGCKNELCADGFLCAIEDREVSGRPDLSVEKGACFRAGCAADKDCDAKHHCVAPLDGGPRFCAPIPLPLEQGPQCQTDAQCRFTGTAPTSCDTDADCKSPFLECRRATSLDKSKTCVDKEMVCSAFPGLKGRCVRASPCFNELLNYDVLAGRAFLVGGYRRIIADKATKECVPDTEESPLLARRVPVGMASYPVIAGQICSATPAPLTTPSPNPCFERSPAGYVGTVDPTASSPILKKRTPGTVVRYANPDITFSLGVSHLTDVTASGGSSVDAGVTGTAFTGTAFSSMPERGLTFLLNISSGYASLRTSTTSTISLPVLVVDGPDGNVYVVDMGDRSGSTGSAGQVIRFNRNTMELDNDFVVR
jgi:hypothetical protein